MDRDLLQSVEAKMPDLTPLEKAYISGLLHKQLGWLLVGGDGDKLQEATDLTISICRKLELEPMVKKVHHA